MEQNEFADEMYLGLEDELGLPSAPALPTGEIMRDVRPIWAADLNQMDFPEPSYLVDALISKGGINAISSKPGTYKTMLAIEIAKCVANGEPLFGVYETKQTKVLILDQESGHGRLKKRLAVLGAANSDIAIVSFANVEMSKDYAEATIQYCRNNGIGLIIYDSLTRFHSAKENNSDEMSAVLANFQLLTQAGLTVLIIHHDPKSGYDNPDSSNTLRGSSDILAICDVHIVLQKAKNARDKIIVKQLKNRDDEAIADFGLIARNNDDKSRLWFEHIGEAPRDKPKDEITDEAIMAYLNGHGHSSQEDIITALSGAAGQTKVANRLKELAASHELNLSIAAHGKKYFDLPKESDNE